MPSVILATAGYDHTIRFWEAPSGICYRTIPYADSVNKKKILIYSFFFFLFKIIPKLFSK